MIKTYKHIKFTILCLAFLASVFYAVIACRDLIYRTDYSKSLTLRSLKLDSTKTYLFTTSFRNSYSKDTIILPVENKSLPDSLCYLFFDTEWKLKLTVKLRKNDKDSKTNILFPWCCTQEDKPIFFQPASLISQSKLLRNGIKFNYFSGIGTDRFSINLEKQNGSYFLRSNLMFLGSSYPVSIKKENIFELDFCNYGDTIKNKYVFSLPFLSSKFQPDRKFLKINNSDISWGDSTVAVDGESQVFNIQSLQFELKDNFAKKTKNNLSLLLWFVPLISIYILYRLGKLLYRLPYRNLQVIEQSNILILRVVFNCIILLGFPILILKIKFSPGRLYWYSILVLLLNINWIWLFNKIGQTIIGKWVSNKFRSLIKPISRERWSTILLIFILFTIALIWKSSNNEKLFGKFPILHITKFLYILLPFIVTNRYIVSFGKISILKNTSINFSYILVGFLSFIIALVSSDWATFLFTMLAILFIQVLERGGFRFIWRQINSAGFLILLFLFSSIIYIYRSSIFSISKVYRFISTIGLPTNDMFKDVDEQSKQTVAQQMYLLKSTVVDNSFLPSFKTVVLPSWKSTFFSDYAVLWSFKAGGYYFIALYFLLLIFVSYSIISLLIILNKKIPLHNGQMVSYSRNMVLIFNILLSIFLVQYIYTFLSNLWLLPVTGQSPGVLCPSFFEVGFHLLFINAVYYYIDKKEIKPIPDKYPLTYTKLRRKSSKWILLIFVGSLILLSKKIYTVMELPNTMKWVTNADKKSKELAQEGDLETKALKAYQNNDKTLFKLLHQKYFNSANYEADSFIVSTNFIDKNTDIDSVTNLQFGTIKAGEDSLTFYKKQLNSREIVFINNSLYSGCPINSTTINFSLQRDLNVALNQWSNRINADNSNGHIMLGGAILVVSNSGNIRASASFPQLYNENNYHLKSVEDKINKVTPFKFKYYTTENYINVSEFDQMPGSIVKPLLAYSGLKFYDPGDLIINKTSLRSFLGNSLPEYARILFQRMANDNLDTLKAIYQNDFSISQFYDLDVEKVRTLNEETNRSYAIGQQNKLVFKDIVQAYTRIKTGRKIKFTYSGADTSQLGSLSLTHDKLLILQDAMQYSLINGTASDVGRALVNNRVNFNGFLAKTGTPQIGKSENHNKTSAFIIVTDDFTIGIQLFGDLPKNQNIGGLAARNLFINIITDLIKHHILEQSAPKAKANKKVRVKKSKKK